MLFQESQQKFGVLPLVTATLTTSVIALGVAIPLGLGAAIYLAEYASPRARRVLKPILEVLAGIPTVVYGFFALAFITPELLQRFLDVGTFSMLSAGLVMGVMIIPTVASLSEDAMTAVPQALRTVPTAWAARRCTWRRGSWCRLRSRDRGGVRPWHQPCGRRDDDRRARRRQYPGTTFNPLEAETMTAFIAQAASGGHRIIGYESCSPSPRCCSSSR